MGLRSVTRKIAFIYALATVMCCLLIRLHLSENKKSDTNDKERRVHLERKLNATLTNFNFKNTLLSPSAKLSELPGDVTVVTAYFNLGAFRKAGDTFKPELYYSWMRAFSLIKNPLVVYLETDNDTAYFEEIRGKTLPLNYTKIVKVNRTDLWSFRLVTKIEEIYRQPSYPKHYPNTVRAEYSSAMHAKYELIQKTILENPFQTKYICWLDIGYFRDLLSSHPFPSVPKGPLFHLSLPDGFDRGKIAYTQVESHNGQKDAQKIVESNVVWICGGFFIGQMEVMFPWTVIYMDGVERMLKHRWISTDQQVLYWMHGNNLNTTKIQTYRETSGRHNPWFHLGYLSKEASERIMSLEMNNTSQMETKSLNTDQQISATIPVRTSSDKPA